jgi:hypothetical protein
MMQSTLRRTATIYGRLASVALVTIIGASCSRVAAPPACLQFSADLMPDLAGGLIRKDFRIANAWGVKSDTTIDSVGVKVPAYFLSADVIAPNGEAIVVQAGGAETAGITMDKPGAKESITCVLNGRAKAPQPGVAPGATTP